MEATSGSVFMIPNYSGYLILTFSSPLLIYPEKISK